jgi:hypothetical protein
MTVNFPPQVGRRGVFDLVVQSNQHSFIAVVGKTNKVSPTVFQKVFIIFVCRYSFNGRFAYYTSSVRRWPDTFSSRRRLGVFLRCVQNVSFFAATHFRLPLEGKLSPLGD